MLAGCTESYDDWASPNLGGSEDGKSISLNVSPAAAIDFADIDDLENATVQLFVPEVTASEDNNTHFVVTLWNEDKTQSREVRTDANGYVSASDLKTAVEELYGKRPVPRVIDMNVIGYVNINGQSLKATGSTTSTITPAAPIIYDMYYVVGNVVAYPDDALWNITYTGLPLTNGGVDPYENPIFTGRIPVPADGSNVEFKLNPVNGPDDWSLCLGAGAEEGTFVTNNKGGNMVIPADPQAVAYDLTFNMMDETWSYKPVYGIEDVYYIIGTPQGWNENDTSYPVYSGSGAPGGIDPVFQVRLPATGSNIEFKLCPESGIGSWDSDFTASVTGEAGKLSANNAGGNIVIEHQLDAIAYDVWFNLQSLEWGYRAIKGGDLFFEIGNESGWSKSHAMALKDGLYIGYYFLNGEFKFKPNEGDWSGDLEYDGAAENATGKVADNGGSNMPAPETGFYKIVLDTNAMTYTLTQISTVGVIGDATADGWNSDQDMTWNAEYGYWHIENLQLNDGKIKFRGNDNWNGDLDLGGTPNELWIGGADIPVEAGTYDIKLFPSYSGGSHCIITKK